MSNINPPLDPSIIHIAPELMTQQQADQWNELLLSDDGRQRALDWLMLNDPMVRKIYNVYALLGLSEDEQHLAAVLMLVHAMRSIQLNPTQKQQRDGAHP